MLRRQFLKAMGILPCGVGLAMCLKAEGKTGAGGHAQAFQKAKGYLFPNRPNRKLTPKQREQINRIIRRELILFRVY
jgi:hypothetical protein